MPQQAVVQGSLRPFRLHPQMHGRRLADAIVINPLGLLAWAWLRPGGGLSIVDTGSRINRQAQRRLSGAVLLKHRRYLFFNGIQQVWTASDHPKKRSNPVSAESELVIHRRRKASALE